MNDEQKKKHEQESNERKELTDFLLKKHAEESKLFAKENSFHAKVTGPRDVVVHLAVTVLDEVDGHKVIGEEPREYNQWCFRLPASQLPVDMQTATKAYAELMTLGKQALIKLGMLRP